MSRIELIDVIETALLSFMLSGVLWNVAAGYGVVHASQLTPGIALTTALLMAVFGFDMIDEPVRT